MSPSLALSVWLVLLLVLLSFDPARVKGMSLAMWVPVIWMFIAGSRLASQWFGMNRVGTVAQALEEGNPLDRTISSILILLAIAILMSRSFQWVDFLRRNFALVAFLLFALFSVLWSDFPFIAFKRWFRDLGNYLVILVVLSDPRPLDAVRTLLRRLCYLLVPLSILLIKYFPAIGRQYEVWSGSVNFVGAATSKNMLGAICLISGIFFFWDTVTRWTERRERHTKRIITANLALMAMTFWLLSLARSATSTVCLVIGCVVILAVHSKWSKRHPTFLKVSIPAIFCLYIILAFGFGLSGEFASQVGRDPTLTERTLIWSTVLNMHTNPLVGTGYQTFWLGPRLFKVWEAIPGINEAHNGYLDVYLNLGIIGLALVLGFLITCYGRLCKQIGTSFPLTSLSLAVWTILLFYNVTEAAFCGGLLWMILLPGSIALSRTIEDQRPIVAAVNNVNIARPFPGPSLEVTSQRR